MSVAKRLIEAVRIGRWRQAVHVMHDNDCTDGEGEWTNPIGVAGELQFELESGYTMNRTLDHRGDSGIDFNCPGGTVDVKCVQKKPHHLFIEVGKAVADYFVMYRFFSFTDVRFIGWCTRADALRAPQRVTKKLNYEPNFRPSRADLLELLRTVTKRVDERPASGLLF